MSFTTPKTWAYKETLSSSDLNTYVRDNITFLKSALYPIGSIYIATVSTNPATLLGFGTWVAIAEAEALVGYKSGDTPFGTVGSIGAAGAKTVAADLAAHTHITYGVISAAGSGSALRYPVNEGESPNSNTTTGSTGAGGGHNNIQPSFVVYIWKRTA